MRLGKKSQEQWRVVYLTRGFRPYDPGPWHPSKDVAEGWERWFKSLGHDVYVQSSCGTVYREGFLYRMNTRLN